MAENERTEDSRYEDNQSKSIESSLQSTQVQASKIDESNYKSSDMNSPTAYTQFIINTNDDSSSSEEKSALLQTETDIVMTCDTNQANLEEFIEKDINLSSVQAFLNRARDNKSGHLVNTSNNLIMLQHEATTKTSLALKKKELLWKLHKSSWIQNKTKLEQVRTEAIMKKKKMKKLTTAALRLKAKYLKAAKSARTSIQSYKNIEKELLEHEKFVAHEQMLLAKLEVDCKQAGTQLYGPVYQLIGNTNITGVEDGHELNQKLKATKLVIKKQIEEFEKRASANSPAGAKRLLALNLSKTALSSIVGAHSATIYHSIKIARILLKSMIEEICSEFLVNQCDHKLCFMYKPSIYVHYRFVGIHRFESKWPTTKTEAFRLQLEDILDRYESELLKKLGSSNDGIEQQVLPISFQTGSKKAHSDLMIPKALYFSKESPLKNLASFRLTNRFFEENRMITDHQYTHNIYPNDYICLADFVGTCTDKNCLYQHKIKYMMSDIEKLTDLLSYKPSLTGFKYDPNLSKVENDRLCTLRLKEYAAELISKNSDKSVELIAKNLVKYVRSNKPDRDIIAMRRVVPKINQINTSKSQNPGALILEEAYLRRLATHVEHVTCDEYDLKPSNSYFEEKYRLKFPNSNLYELDSKRGFLFLLTNETNDLDKELKQILSSDPHNVQAWIKLAFNQISISTQADSSKLNTALTILRSALESNPSDEELWYNYLTLSLNKSIPSKEDSELQNIQSKALENCPTFKIYKLCIAFVENISMKFQLTENLIENLKNVCQKSDEIQRTILAKSLMEAILFLVQLHISQDDFNQGVHLAISSFKGDYSEQTTEEPSSSKNVSHLLTIDQLYFAQLCILHLKLYETLPSSRIVTNGHTFPTIVSMAPFVIKVSDGLLNSELDGSKEFKKLAGDLQVPHDFSNGFFGELKFCLPTDEILHLYLQAKVCFESEQTQQALKHINSIIEKHRLTSGGSIDIRRIDDVQELKQALKQLIKNNSKENSIELSLLWLSLVVTSKLAGDNDQEVEGLYLRATNQCSQAINRNYSAFGLKILVNDYVHYLVARVKDAVSFDCLVSAVRHWCIIIEDQDFQAQLVETLINSIGDSNSRLKLFLLVEFCKLLPAHNGLLNWTIRFAMINSYTDIPVGLMDYLLFERNQFATFDDWTWLMALKIYIESGDHYKTHRTFKLAASHRPFNSQLWKMMRTYERSVYHQQHESFLEGMEKVVFLKATD